MKWSIIILISLQVLLIEAQELRLIKHCGIKRTCVEATNCRSHSNLIDIRKKQKKVCNDFETCCREDNQVLKADYREVEPNCGFRNQGNTFPGLPFPKRNETDYAEFPWVVGIMRKEDNRTQYICSGSIITPKIILTAAHCVNNQAAKDLIVIAGEWDTHTELEPFPIQKKNVKYFFYDKKFSEESLHFDVALLVLEVPFMFDQNVRSICLPITDQINQTECFTTGWGKNQFGREGKNAEILKKIRLPLVGSEDCQKKMRKTRLGEKFELHESFVCAGGQSGVDACTGDGGAPLFCRLNGPDYRYVQVGTVAWGIGCGTQNVPGVYANLSYMLRWLIGSLNRLDADPRYYTI